MNNLLNVIDIEATCWKDKSPPPGQTNEIIEIGLCVLNLDTHERLEKHSILVRPERSEVSEFCTELTGWTAKDLQDAPTFSQACERLHHEFHADSRPWASWGDYDRKQFEQQCEATNTPYPFSQRHSNAKKVFTEAKGLKKRPGMDAALAVVGLPLEGRHHKGVDDAWNIAALITELLKEGKWGKGL